MFIEPDVSGPVVVPEPELPEPELPEPELPEPELPEPELPEPELPEPELPEPELPEPELPEPELPEPELPEPELPEPELPEPELPEPELPEPELPEPELPEPELPEPELPEPELPEPELPEPELPEPELPEPELPEPELPEPELPEPELPEPELPEPELPEPELPEPELPEPELPEPELPEPELPELGFSPQLAGFVQPLSPACDINRLPDVSRCKSRGATTVEPMPEGVSAETAEGPVVAGERRVNCAGPPAGLPVLTGSRNAYDGFSNPVSAAVRVLAMLLTWLVGFAMPLAPCPDCAGLLFELTPIALFEEEMFVPSTAFKTELFSEIKGLVGAGDARLVDSGPLFAGPVAPAPMLLPGEAVGEAASVFRVPLAPDMGSFIPKPLVLALLVLELPALELPALELPALALPVLKPSVLTPLVPERSESAISDWPGPLPPLLPTLTSPPNVRPSLLVELANELVAPSFGPVVPADVPVVPASEPMMPSRLESFPPEFAEGVFPPALTRV